jgi:hypothetical protein
MLRAILARIVGSARCGALLAALSAFAFARSVAAFPSARLVYVRGPGAEHCPDQDVVRKSVSARLGYDPFFPNSDKTIVARVVRQGERLSGHVELVDEQGVQVGLREFSADPEQCEDLIAAVALSISIAIDPQSAETYGKGPPDEPASSALAAPGRPVEANESRPASAPDTQVRAHRGTAPRMAMPAPPHPWTASLGLVALTTWFNPPNPILGLGLFGTVRRGAWSIGLEGRGELPVTRQQRDVETRSSTLAVSAVPCFHLGLGFACVVGSLRWLSAIRTDTGASNGPKPYWAMGGRAGAELALSQSFGLLGYLELSAAPRPPVVVAVSEPLWRPPVFSADLAIAGAVHF